MTAEKYPPRVWLTPRKLRETDGWLCHGSAEATTERRAMADELYISMREHEHLIKLAKAEAFEEAAGFLTRSNRNGEAVYVPHELAARKLLDKAKQLRAESEGAKDG